MEIRDMAFDDLDFFNKVRSESYMFLHDKKNYTLEENKKWFKNLKDPYFIIIYDGNPIGYVRTSNWLGDSVYVGMDISKEFRGNGFSYLAYEKLFNILKNKYNINTVYLEVLSTNERAYHIYKKLNFIEVDRFKYNNEESIKMVKKINKDGI
jgi:RimJ/RimL family protein N-acetyltransferase